MKRIITVVMAAAAVLSLTGCDFLKDLLGGVEVTPETPYTDQWANLVNETSHEAVVDGNTLTYGSHTYTVNGEIDLESNQSERPTAQVIFSNIPSGYTEFEAVYKGLLGKSIIGAAAMVPMAMEIYARNATTGEKCFNLLCNSSSTATGIIRELKRKIVPSYYSEADDQYIQRYLPAALLKGATQTNAYSPDTPYTVELGITSSGINIQDAPLTGGTVYYICIHSQGWDTYRRGVDIFQPYDSEYYQVFNCPSCYTQCKNIRGTFGGLK